jgi:glucose-1-phosphate adenylyltransferase
LLIELIESAALEEKFDFVNDIVIRQRKQKNIVAYIHEGYWRSIAELSSYYKANMEFLKKDMRDLFFKETPSVLSKVEDEPPAKFNQGTKVSNSLCSSGCIINGTVIDSLLFRKVFIGKNTVIRNSIILNGTYIGDNCLIENCIVDSSSTISDGSVFQSDTEEPRIVVNKEEIFF